jgi:hypothetical protein
MLVIIVEILGISKVADPEFSTRNFGHMFGTNITDYDSSVTTFPLTETSRSIDGGIERI